MGNYCNLNCNKGLRNRDSFIPHGSVIQKNYDQFYFLDKNTWRGTQYLYILTDILCEDQLSQVMSVVRGTGQEKACTGASTTPHSDMNTSASEKTFVDSSGKIGIVISREMGMSRNDSSALGFQASNDDDSLTSSTVKMHMATTGASGERTPQNKKAFQNEKLEDQFNQVCVILRNSKKLFRDVF